MIIHWTASRTERHSPTPRPPAHSTPRDSLTPNLKICPYAAGVHPTELKSCSIGSCKFILCFGTSAHACTDFGPSGGGSWLTPSDPGHTDILKICRHSINTHSVCPTQLLIDSLKPALSFHTCLGCMHTPWPTAFPNSRSHTKPPRELVLIGHHSLTFPLIEVKPVYSDSARFTLFDQDPFGEVGAVRLSSKP